MNQSVDQLALQAAALSRDEQIALLDRIREMIEPTRPDIDAAWIAEAESRWAAYRSGEMETFDADEVLDELRGRPAGGS